METQLEQAARLAAAATVRRSTLAVLPAGEERITALLDALSPLLTMRSLPDWLPPQWLAAAQDVLASTEDIELFVQHDPVLETLTLELWRDGHRLFGTDVWIG
jgi:hypothetical protein